MGRHWRGHHSPHHSSKGRDGYRGSPLLYLNLRLRRYAALRKVCDIAASRPLGLEPAPSMPQGKRPLHGRFMAVWRSPRARHMSGICSARGKCLAYSITKLSVPIRAQREDPSLYHLCFCFCQHVHRMDCLVVGPHTCANMCPHVCTHMETYQHQTRSLLQPLVHPCSCL